MYEDITERIYNETGKITSWRSNLLDVICKFHSCRSLKFSNRSEYEFILIGQDEDLDRALELYSQFLDKIEIEINYQFVIYKGKGGYQNGKSFKSNCARSIVANIRKKLYSLYYQTRSGNEDIDINLCRKEIRVKEYIEKYHSRYGYFEYFKPISKSDGELIGENVLIKDLVEGF